MDSPNPIVFLLFVIVMFFLIIWARINLPPSWKVDDEPRFISAPSQEIARDKTYRSDKLQEQRLKSCVTVHALCYQE